MSAEPVDEQTILDALRHVPRNRWSDVQAYLRSLGAVESSSRAVKCPMTAADLLQSGLVGLWADRTDMGDSREFARRLREQAQTRKHDQ